MEGVNFGGMMIGCFALLEFGVASLIALGLLIASRPRPAKLVFASGLLVANLIAAFAALTFLSPQYNHSAGQADIILTALSLTMAGAGQFLAALRGPLAFALSLGLALVSIMLLIAVACPDVLGDVGVRMDHDLGMTLSVVFAAASLGVGLLAQVVQWKRPASA